MAENERRRPTPTGAVTRAVLEEVLRPMRAQMEDHEITLYGDHREGKEKDGLVKLVAGLLAIADKYKLALAVATLLFNTATTLAILVLQYLQYLRSLRIVP